MSEEARPTRGGTVVTVKNTETSVTICVLHGIQGDGKQNAWTTAAVKPA